MFAAFRSRFFMPITKQKKEEILKELKDNLKKSQIVIFVNFHGLDVAAANELRGILRGLGAKYTVAKKTLTKIALKEMSFSGDAPELEGEIGIAFSESDPITAAKELQKFAKEKEIKLIGGVFENKYIDGNTVVMLANIPSREVLLAQFANVINSPVKGMVVTLNGVMKNFVSALSQIKK